MISDSTQSDLPARKEGESKWGVGCRHGDRSDKIRKADHIGRVGDFRICPDSGANAGIGSEYSLLQMGMRGISIGGFVRSDKCQ